MSFFAYIFALLTEIWLLEERKINGSIIQSGHVHNHEELECCHHDEANQKSNHACLLIIDLKEIVMDESS